MVKTLKARGTGLNKAVGEVSILANGTESVHQVIERNKNNPAVINLEGYFHQIKSELAESKYDMDELEFTDIESRINIIRETQRAMAVNGGTIDISTSSGALGTSTGALDVVGGAYAATDIYALAPGSASLEMGTGGAVTSLWWKSATGILGVAANFYHDGTTAYDANPTFDIIVPANVPNGILKIIGKRRGLDILQVSNTAGTDLTNVTGMRTTGSTLAVSDQLGPYWTWGSGSDNEEFAFYRRVNKATGLPYIVTVELDLQTSAQVNFSAYFEVEFVPHDVRLRDLFISMLIWTNLTLSYSPFSCITNLIRIALRTIFPLSFKT
jgi:hypothetical protein